MQPKTITLSNIRPYVRFAISVNNMLHTAPVTAFEHRLIYMNEGEARFFADGREFYVRKHELFLVSAGVSYCMQSVGQSLSSYLYFDLTMENNRQRSRLRPVSAIPEEMLLCHYRLLYKDEPVRVLHLSDAAFLWNSISRIMRCLDNGTGGAFQDDIISGMMVSVIAMLFERLERLQPRSAAEEVADLATEYIHRHYAEHISIDDIAAAIQFHKSYTNRCVKKQTGLSVHRYLLDYRLEQAMQFLMYTNLSVSEVAEATGFGNAKHFSTAFQKRYGLPPSKVMK